MLTRSYREVSSRACKRLVLDHHYSGRMPSNIQLCYADTTSPPLTVLACALFSIAAGRWEASNLWELTRLVRLDDYDTQLTRLIGKSIGYIRSRKLTDLVLSFADLEEDHHGGIYQASSWIYSGPTGSRLDGFNVDGVFVPARTCNVRYGTSSVDGVISAVPDSLVEPHYDQGKHLYWKPLNRVGMQQAMRMGLKSLPYPKPMLINGVPTNRSQSEFMAKGKVNLTASTHTINHADAKPLQLGKVMAHKKGPR